MKRISFFVPGKPGTAGSKRGFIRGGKVILVDASGKKGQDWRGDVKRFAIDAGLDGFPIAGPVKLEITFWMPRPKNHYRANGDLKDSSPFYHTKRADATKMLRALEDALTGIIWNDDGQVCVQDVKKFYSSHSGKIGASITVTELN